MNELNIATSAKKGANSAGTAAGGLGLAYGVILIGRYGYHHEFSVDEAVAIMSTITIAVSGIGRAIENVVRWYRNLSKEVVND